MRLTFISADPSNPSKALYRCTCGTEKMFWRSNVRPGHTMSCGCLRTEMIVDRSLTHGHKSNGERSRTYVIWMNMKARCSNPKVKSFADYGARGIKVCDRWQIFENFLSDMGEIPDGLTIDRIDNDKGYSQENCRLATKAEQSRNKRDNVNLVFNGITKTLAEWAREFGIKRLTLRHRIIEAGWSVERALTTPVRVMT